ncbi:MAG: PEP-CTERM sorting domain-containing protein [Pirellulaceae bacterium]|nr:PEP-CTERM sorting domain-containing protein [Pirellulaceae bacterium]
MCSRIGFVVMSFLLTVSSLDTNAVAGILLDPLGDAQLNSLGQPGIDLTSLEVTIGNTSVEVILNFSALTPILPASAAAPNSVFGFVEFDLDLDPSTGSNPGLVDVFGSLIGQLPTGLGVDGTILLGSEANQAGMVDLFFASGATGLGTLTTTSTSMHISFSRSLLGGATELNFAAVVGDFNVPTDATSVGFANVSAVPEPSSLWMMGFAGALLIAVRPSRRRRSILG